MALQISTYTDPGVYIGEVIVPGAINIATTPVQVGLIGVGDREKRVTNEAVQRGLVAAEALTVSPTVSAHDATLVNRSDRRLQNTTIYRNGVALGDNFIEYRPGFIIGTSAGTYNVAAVHATRTAIGLSMDGKPAVTIRITNGAPGVTVVGNTQVDVVAALGGAGAAATRAEIAAAINSGLAALTDTAMGFAASSGLGYGTAYAAVATDATSGVQITSPVSTYVSDVKLFEPVADLTAATYSIVTTVFGAPGASNRNAQSVVRLNNLVYSATAVYTIDYINIGSNADPLLNTGVTDILKVGSFAGVGNFIEGTDWKETGSTIDWGGTGSTPDLPAIFTGSGFSGAGVVTGASDNLLISLDGKSSIAIDLIGAAVTPHGYTSATSGAATAAEVAANINAVLVNNKEYGLAYRAVASVSGGQIVLTSPVDGQAYSIVISAPTTFTATLAVFGLAASQLPSTTVGAGKRPALAAIYFATYAITRATADYNIQKRYFSLDQVKADLGQTTSTNLLVLAAEIAFANGAPSLVCVQVNDLSSAGSPTRQEFLNALNALKTGDIVTDVLALTTSLDVQTDVKDHIENESSPTEKHYRRAWFGMPRSTNIGDKDTANTFVYRARRTFQFSADSPGRGRLLLVAPPQLTGVSRDITLEDGTTQTINLDSSYLAVALAAKKSSFTSPAASLARKTITGFNLADVINPWLRAERGTMAGQGVMVVTFDAGLFKVLDPVTTEAGGGGLAAFAYESTSSQKDNVSRKVDQALDANIVGIVPTDLSDFIVDIKLVIGAVLQGEIGSLAIGPFRNANGTPRSLDYTTDLEVQQSPNDPTKFFFKYWYNLRYPALRLFGEFSVDSPFFSSSG